MRAEGYTVEPFQRSREPRIQKSIHFVLTLTNLEEKKSLGRFHSVRNLCSVTNPRPENIIVLRPQHDVPLNLMECLLTYKEQDDELFNLILTKYKKGINKFS